MEKRKDKSEERVEDLEVQKDETDEVAGGKRKAGFYRGSKKAGKSANPWRYGRESGSKET